jgi:hypothetical protein
MNRHERRAVKARKTRATSFGNREMIDKVLPMLGAGLGKLKFEVCHLTKEDTANSSFSDLLRQAHELECPLCNQALDTGGFGALAMISPGGDYVMDFDEQGLRDEASGSAGSLRSPQPQARVGSIRR